MLHLKYQHRYGSCLSNGTPTFFSSIFGHVTQLLESRFLKKIVQQRIRLRNAKKSGKIELSVKSEVKLQGGWLKGEFFFKA
jgi:hypothetical protein